MQQLMEPREWQNLSVPMDTLYAQLSILTQRLEVVQGMNKPEMVASIQSGIDRLNKIIAYRITHDKQENNHK